MTKFEKATQLYALSAVSDNADAVDPWIKEFEKVRTLDTNGELWFVVGL